MASLAGELITYLKTQSDVTDLVGSGTAARIYRHLAKQGVSLPYIVMRIYEGVSYRHLSAITGIRTNRVQVVCYAATDDGADQLAEAVRLSVDHYRGTMGTTDILDIEGESVEPGFEPPVKGGNQRRYWHSRDFVFTYREATS